MGADPLRASAGRLTAEAAGAYLGDLFEQHGRLVYGVCRLMLRDRGEAEDAAQQTFLSAYRSLLSGHVPRDAVPWLATIARNECRARIRGRMAEPLMLVDESNVSATDLETVTSRRAEIAALCDALAELPAPQRDAIVLREFYGLSYEEVSAVVGVSVSAVDALLVRARRRLQAELRPSRLASGALVVPLAVKESLAFAVPGFASGASASGLVAKLASLPIAAKLAGAVATVAVVTTVGSVGPPSPRALTGGGASSVHVASADSPADADPGGEQTPVALTPRKHDGGAGRAAKAGRGENDEDEANEDEHESGDDGGGDDADDRDAPDEAGDPDGGGESDEPDSDASFSSSGPGSDEPDEPDDD